MDAHVLVADLSTMLSGQKIGSGSSSLSHAPNTPTIASSARRASSSLQNSTTPISGPNPASLLTLASGPNGRKRS